MHNGPRQSRRQLAARSNNVPKSELVSDIKLLGPEEWSLLRDIRLRALRESPGSFLASYEREVSFGPEEWRAEFARGEWSIGFIDTAPAGLLGTTRERETPADQCYLEYMWVAPEFRRSGLAHRLLAVVLGRLRNDGVKTVFLWVLDGNAPAEQLYKSVGFVSTSQRQPLQADPARFEELMQLNLGRAS